MDPLIVIKSTTTAVLAISSIYGAIRHLRGLPTEIHDVGMNIHLARDILRLACQQLKGLAVDESSTKALEPVVSIFEKQATTLLCIFKEFEKNVKNANNRSMLNCYRTSLLPLGRSPWEEIEILMQRFFGGLVILATNHLVKMATQSQRAELKKAIDRLTNVKIFVPDSDFNSPGTDSQNIVYRGSGYQHTRKDILRTLYTSPYRDTKNRNPDRVPGTCEWFVSNHDFQRWRESKSSTMLWVSANPGCGKSVLAKYLVDSELETTESRTTCYFFFKDGFGDQGSAKSALSCILQQLFIQRGELFSGKIFKRLRAYTGGHASSFDELWEILVIASQDKSAGELVCILDAFDECESQERFKLAQALRKFYDPENGTKNNAHLKFLVTSRSYDKIGRGFYHLSIPGLKRGKQPADIENGPRDRCLYRRQSFAHPRKPSSGNS
ncbi:hypothetical protein V2G26_014936 [Clonostachys chloroleuca]